MNQKIYFHRIVLATLLTLFGGSLFANTIIPATNNKLQYNGRIDFSDPASPQISWPGTSIAAVFTGSYLAVKLNDQFGKNYFNVFIDNDFTHPHIVEAIKGAQTYVIATNLEQGQHSFLLTKRTEGEEGATGFKGIELEDNAILHAPPARPTRRIEFFGDSITSGMGNESADNGPDDSR